MFSNEQRKVLLNEYGMTSTHHRNSELIERCRTKVGTTVERVKVSCDGSSLWLELQFQSCHLEFANMDK